MSDRRELDELSQRLLRSAAADRPTEEARRRTAVALGLAAPLPPPAAPSGGSAASAGSSAGIPAAAATSSGAAGAPLAAAASGLPWVAKLVLGVALTAGATAPLWPSRDPEPAPAAVVAPASRPPSVPAPLQPPPSAAPIEVPAATVAPEAPAKTSNVRRAPRPKAPELLPEPATLAEETALLERAHRAWSAKDLPEMDQALADYRRRCPNGRLGREAELLGLDRLWIAGDQRAFEAAAQDFERRYPVPGLPPRLKAHVGGPP